jgi:hypothetical protein
MKNDLTVVLLAAAACVVSSYRGKSAFQRAAGAFLGGRFSSQQPHGTVLAGDHEDFSIASILAVGRGGTEPPEGVTLQGTTHAEDLYLPGLLDTTIVRSKSVRSTHCSTKNNVTT